MTNRAILIMAALAAALILHGCAPKMVKTVEFGDPDWETKQTAVDAFTAASTPADAARIADMLRTRINAILNAAA